MKVVAFLGSPRVQGNTEILLKEALKPINEAGHETTLIRPDQMNISPCLNCGACDASGECIINDEMDEVYELIRKCDRFIMASPIYFAGLTAQIKTMIDRCQSVWCEKFLLNRDIPSGPEGRKGLLIMVGSHDKEMQYKCGNTTAAAFFRTISVPEHQTLYYTGIDAMGEVDNRPDAFKEVFEAGQRLVAKV